MFLKSRYLKPYIKKFFLSYLLGILGLIIVDVAQVKVPEVTGKIVDGLTKASLNLEDLKYFVFILAIIGVCSFIGKIIWRYFMIVTAKKIEFHLRNQFFSKIQELSQSFFTKHKTGDLMAYATNDLNAITMALGQGILISLDALILLALILIKMIKDVNVTLTIFAILPLPIIAIGAVKLGKEIHKRFSEKQDAFAKLTDEVNETISGIHVIKSFTQEDYEKEHFKEINLFNYHKNMKVIKIIVIAEPLIGVIVGISLLITLVYGGRLTILNKISLGDFVAFIQYLIMLIWPMIALGWSINIFSQSTASLKRFERILDEKPEIYDNKNIEKGYKIKGEITIKDLNFAYPGTKVPVLKNIDMKIKKGETIGIIGKTGSGKTTLMDLLLRIYNCDHEQIMFDGKDIRDIALEDLRSQIAYVTQESFLFSDTIKNNIKFSNQSKSDEEMVEAAKIANIHDNIVEFPEKYETIVGERGVTLSGGQKQRVAIARALLDESPILILDDSVSAVDTKTEEKIMGHLFERRKDSTTFIIAHRISTIQKADHIFVFEQGRIIEEGSHEELISKEGYYYDIAQKQQLEKEIDLA